MNEKSIAYAIRPYYIANLEDKSKFVVEENIRFRFFSGFSKTQKQRSLLSMHENIKNYLGFDSKILEISTKSLEGLGVSLSAFNLILSLKNRIKTSVERAYQGSKVFEYGGPFTILYTNTESHPKKFELLYNSGKLKYFDLFGEIWDLKTKTAFYDFLYIKALNENKNLAEEMIKFDIFTDIEFNPKKSFSNQAKAAALYKSLKHHNLLNKALKSKDDFLEILNYQNKNCLF